MANFKLTEPHPRSRLAGLVHIATLFDDTHSDRCIDRDLLRDIYRGCYSQPVPAVVLDDLASLYEALEKSESRHQPSPKRRSRREITVDLIAGRWLSETTLKGALARIADELNTDTPPGCDKTNDDHVDNALDTAARRLEHEIERADAADAPDLLTETLVIYTRRLVFEWQNYSHLWRRARQHHGAPLTPDVIDGLFGDGLFAVWREEIGDGHAPMPFSEAFGALSDRIIKVREERRAQKLKTAGVNI